MKRFRVSIAVLMTIVALVAIDFAWFTQTRLVTGTSKVAIIGVLFMGNILALVASHVASRRGGNGPFAKGFLAFGSAAVFTYLGSVWMFPVFTIVWAEAVWEWALAQLTFSFLHKPTTTGNQAMVAQLAPAAVICLPQLLFALMGGWLVQRRARRLAFNSRGFVPAKTNSTSGAGQVV